MQLDFSSGFGKAALSSGRRLVYLVRLAIFEGEIA